MVAAGAHRVQQQLVEAVAGPERIAEAQAGQQPAAEEPRLGMLLVPVAGIPPAQQQLAALVGTGFDQCFVLKDPYTFALAHPSYFSIGAI